MVASPHESATAHGPRASRPRKRWSGWLLADVRGLSSLEYAVLFVLLVVGGLALWRGLAGTVEGNVGGATDEFSSALAGDQARGGRHAAAERATSGTSGGVPSGARGRFSAPDSSGSGPSPQGSHLLSSGGGAASIGQGAGQGGTVETSGSSTPGQPSQAEEAPSLWDSARAFVRESANSQLALGIAAGTASSVVWPLGFVPSPEGAGRNFEAGRAIGETATGIAQIYAGGAAILGGTAGGGASVAATVPSGGLSLAGLIPSAAAIDAGIVLVGTGIVNTGRGIWRGYNAMQMADDPPGGGSGNGGSTSGDPPGGGGSSGGGPSGRPGGASDDLATLSRDADAHTLTRHGESVTDEQLQHRARTGVAPDGSTLAGGQIPPISSAFHSNADAVRSLAAARAEVQRRLASMPAGTTVVRIGPVDTGRVVGRGYRRVGGSNPNNAALGPLQRLDDLSHVQGTFRYNPTTGTWDPITMFPTPAP